MTLASQLHEVFLYCLATEEEKEEFEKNNESKDLIEGFKIGCGCIIVESIVHLFAFSEKRLSESTEKIKSFINEMSPTFDKKITGGMSFLNLYMDKNGNQWGEHINCEELLTLGIALNLAGFCIPRPFWSALPGCVPYIWFEFSRSSSCSS